MIEISEQVGNVRRQVTSRILDRGEAHVVSISQTYDTTPDDLWDACTNTDRLPRWFAPVTGDLKLGGRFQIEGNADGTIERCDPPKSFSATWEYGGGISWIEVTVTPEDDGRTRFSLDHISHPNDHWDKYGPGAVGIGWDLTLLGLQLHLASDGKPKDPAEVEAWSASEEGKRFITRSGNGWRDAHIESGVEAAVANAVAARTIGAYTGSTEES